LGYANSVVKIGTLLTLAASDRLEKFHVNVKVARAAVVRISEKSLT
jgi:hypothetical protein